MDSSIQKTENFRSLQKKEINIILITKLKVIILIIFGKSVLNTSFNGSSALLKEYNSLKSLAFSIAIYFLEIQLNCLLTKEQLVLYWQEKAQHEWQALQTTVATMPTDTARRYQQLENERIALQERRQQLLQPP